MGSAFRDPEPAACSSDGGLEGAEVQLETGLERASESERARAELDALALVELSGDMLVRTDPEGRYLYASPSSSAVIVGLPRT